jgi:hypothetical protein
MRQSSRGSMFRGAGLAGRLLVAQTLVVLTGTLTAWLVAAAVGPRLCRPPRRPEPVAPTLLSSLS